MKSLAATEPLASFFLRLEPLEPLLRVILGGAELRADLTFRGLPERKVTLDFSTYPARITEGPPTEPGQIRVTIDGAVMHQILLGELAAGEAFGRRQLLLRGGANALARLIPLLEFAPLLYREHLADLGVPGFGRDPVASEVAMDRPVRNSPLVQRLAHTSELTLQRLVREAAYGVGYGMGLLRHRLWQRLSLFEVLEAMARGIEDARSSAKEAKTRHA